MTGFFTLLSFVIALGAGGWFWLLFVIMFLAWGKALSEKEKVKNETSSSPTPSVDSPMLRLPKPRTPFADHEWRNKLTGICSRYTAPSFYIGESIPLDKLLNAVELYPLNDGKHPIALIDTTLFGSAANGILIGEYGLSWYHSFDKSNASNMLWTEFSELSITCIGSKIIIGNSAIIETAGSRFDIKKIVTLFQTIGNAWKKSFIATAKPTSIEPQVVNPISEQPKASEQSKIRKIDINTAGFDMLLTLPGIGAADAKLILDHIQSHGPVLSIDEIVNDIEFEAPHSSETSAARDVFHCQTRVPGVAQTHAIRCARSRAASKAP
jgi:hypothetical protein